MYTVETICAVTEGEFINRHGNDLIAELVYDSRRIQQAGAALFFAITTRQNDGHRYLSDAWQQGIRNFVISNKTSLPDLADSTVIYVEDGLKALQDLVIFHRSHFQIPVIGITGSNGKTIVKEWLYQLLQDDFQIVRSPKSYNSQVGVPLSVWQLNTQHTLAIFEAGISMPGEMDRLAKLIQPTIGVLTNIGEAHDEGFQSHEQKLDEKLKLFHDTGVIVYPCDQELVSKGLQEWIAKEKNSELQIYSWGESEHAAFRIGRLARAEEYTVIEAWMGPKPFAFAIPFTDEASIENAITCCCVMVSLGYDAEKIRERMLKLHPIDMRLQLNKSFNDCLVINDSYSADLTSLRIALDFLKQQAAGLSRTVILSEFYQTGKNETELYKEIADMLTACSISRVIAIGTSGKMLQERLGNAIKLISYATTDDFIASFRSSQYFKEIILIKGARRFAFERIARLFEKKLHQTVLEINLNALAHNLKVYQRLLNRGTKVMAMVKAFSYGSGGAEIASVLQFHNTDYLGVAYADEGVELVKAGIKIPIMVMNAESSSFQAIVDHNLQPVIYSFELLHLFEAYLKEQGLASYPVHLEVETGMNRLGFALEDIEILMPHIASGNLLRVRSVFSHLAASEEPAQDEFTRQQAQTFREAVSIIEKYISYPFLKHISNSAAIVRHPGLQMDMVRLGIGLYGVEVDPEQILDLEAVATLRSTIAQIKKVKKGESVSYNRRGVMKRDSVIATVRIGYADGYSRQFGNGVGHMWVGGSLAPVTGTVCMDMTMIDITDIADVQEGDEVVLFGPQLPVQEVASWINTIPYELMTAVSQRVKRIYFHE